MLYVNMIGAFSADSSTDVFLRILVILQGDIIELTTVKWKGYYTVVYLCSVALFNM